MFSRGRALRALKLGGGISRIVAKVLHKTSWMGRVETGRHRKAVLQMSASSELPEEAVQRAYVDRMLQLDDIERATGAYGDFMPAAVYAQAAIFAQEMEPAEFSMPETKTAMGMQRTLDDFF